LTLKVCFKCFSLCWQSNYHWEIRGRSTEVFFYWSKPRWTI